ncbi:MAG: hypothetical protein RR198_02495 [Oscillospiraceae bacterium]
MINKLTDANITEQSPIIYPNFAFRPVVSADIDGVAGWSSEEEILTFNR